MGRKVLRTKEEIDKILACGSLELAEDYDAKKSYPKNKYLLTRCKVCKVEAHYRLQYILDKTEIGEPVCRACFWNSWMGSTNPVSIDGNNQNFSQYSDDVDKFGFKLLKVLKDDVQGKLFLVVCNHCGRQTVERSGDILFKCSCQSHPNTSKHYAPKVKRVVSEPRETHIQKTFLTIEQAEITPCSDVPELLEAWDDPRSPFDTMVFPTNWMGMCPGDGQYRFKCKKGHHPYAFPYTYLESGCPACRGQATKGTGLFLADTNPEIASEWIYSRNGSYKPSNVRENSKRNVWWRCLACGHEWMATPRSRQRRNGQLCPHCGKIQGSIAWIYPRLAEQWDSSNFNSPWQVRPNTKLAFEPLWICEKDSTHKYRATVISRIRGASCPVCTKANKSRIELKFFDAVNKHVGTARSGARFEDANFSYNWTIDISFSIHDKRFAIEYDGLHWHEQKQELDRRKSAELLKAGFIVIRLREEGLPSLSINSSNYQELFVQVNNRNFESTVSHLMNCIDGYIRCDENFLKNEIPVVLIPKASRNRTSPKPHSWTQEEELYLMEHPGLSARTLAEHFGVSKKAVERKREKLRKRNNK